MSLLDITKKILKIVIDFFKYLDSKDQNTNQLSSNRQDDTYIKSLLHDNEIQHIKKEIDNLNKNQYYNDDEIRLLRQQVDILSKRCEELLIKQYEHIIEDRKILSQRTPQNDNSNEPKSDNDQR